MASKRGLKDAENEIASSMAQPEATAETVVAETVASQPPVAEPVVAEASPAGPTEETPSL